MAEIRTQATPWTTLYSDNTSQDGDFSPTGGWQAAADVDQGRCTFEVANTTDASGIIKPGFQTANSENSPDAPSLIGSVNSKTGDGVSYPTAMFDLSSALAGKQLVRTGFWFQASAAGLKAARVAARWEFKKC
jgi:hypothetical protein